MSLLKNLIIIYKYLSYKYLTTLKKRLFHTVLKITIVRLVVSMMVTNRQPITRRSNLTLSFRVEGVDVLILFRCY